MIEVHNSEIQDKLASVTGLQSIQSIPRILGNQIIPVIECNPNLLKKTGFVITNGSSSTGATTIMTTKSGRIKTYLTGILITCQYDAAADNTTIEVDFTPKGRAATNIRIAKISLTAISTQIYIPFNYPLQLEKNTNVRVNSAFTVGAGNRSATLFGYEETEI